MFRASHPVTDAQVLLNMQLVEKELNIGPELVAATVRCAAMICSEADTRHGYELANIDTLGHDHAYDQGIGLTTGQIRHMFAAVIEAYTSVGHAAAKACNRLPPWTHAHP